MEGSKTISPWKEKKKVSGGSRRNHPKKEGDIQLKEKEEESA